MKKCTEIMIYEPLKSRGGGGNLDLSGSVDHLKPLIFMFVFPYHQEVFTYSYVTYVLEIMKKCQI